MFLKTENSKIVDATGQPVTLRGVNLGGWLMMEGYFLHSLNIPESHFKKDFAKKLGPEALKDFEKSFRSCFIDQDDINHIAQMGFNCIRVPFHYKLIEPKAGQFSADGVGWLDRVIKWARQAKLWVILDLHAAVGCQNHDWHSDSRGEARLWKSKAYQKRTLALWEFLADRYKNETALAGYDLLNESVVEDAQYLNDFYRRLIKRIRKVDQNHILFVEGNKWATDLAALDVFDDDHLVLSIHSYEPLDYTFNFVPGLTFRKNNYELLKKHLSPYQKIAQSRKRPVFVGEFGVNVRFGHFQEEKWLKDMLRVFNEFGFHWTYWTYKAVKNHIFPDGLLSYTENPAWVNRMGPKMGFETYADCWLKHKEDMKRSWRSAEFKKHDYLIATLLQGTQ